MEYIFSIRTNLHDWKAEKLWKLLDKRVEQAEYRKQRAADRLATLVIGAGLFFNLFPAIFRHFYDFVLFLIRKNIRLSFQDHVVSGVR